MGIVFKTPFIFGLLVFSSLSYSYPSHWWEIVPEKNRKGSWEVLPHEAAKGELILSKRNELGKFSNLARTPFVFESQTYASLEALWQMMKFPMPSWAEDPRLKFRNLYPYTREQVKSLSGFVSKRAGSDANSINKAHNIKWVNYRNQIFNYKDFGAGSAIHYDIIFRAIGEKLRQNPELIRLLKSTKSLLLKPDHKMGETVPPSYEYHKILMLYRDRILK